MAEEMEMTVERESFERWMERALFDPESGYYRTQIATVGRQGDFSTSATISTLLAAGIASWIRDQVKRRDGVRALIEIGGGTGELMRDVRRKLGRWWAWRHGVRWIMVETSLPLRRQQKRRLRGWSTTWCEHPQEALELAGGAALIYHHELVDAFPVQRWRWSESLNQWGEIGVKRQGSRVLGEWVAYDDERGLPDSSVFAKSAWKGRSLKEGQRVEVHESYRRWCETWVPHWRSGAMLTVDYGDAVVGLYERRPEGTVRGYHQHQRMESAEVYRRMGQQDVTADVNFTDLITWGGRLGLESEPLMSLREFLLRQEVAQTGAAQEKGVNAYILDPHGVGCAFKVLVQSR